MIQDREENEQFCRTCDTSYEKCLKKCDRNYCAYTQYKDEILTVKEYELADNKFTIVNNVKVGMAFELDGVWEVTKVYTRKCSPVMVDLERLGEKRRIRTDELLDYRFVGMEGKLL